MKGYRSQLKFCETVNPKRRVEEWKVVNELPAIDGSQFMFEHHFRTKPDRDQSGTPFTGAWRGSCDTCLRLDFKACCNCSSAVVAPLPPLLAKLNSVLMLLSVEIHVV